MKTMLKHLLSAVTVSIFILLAVASSGVKHMTFTKEAGQIPPDFNKFTDTLLVISHSNDWGYNKYLKRNFEEAYTGKYKIIKESEIKNYPAETYRYIFDHYLNYSTKTTVGGPFNGNTSTYASSDVFFVTDRQIGKDYTTKKSSAYYSKLMRAYIKALDEERQK